jgi:uncharacterized damage-inducible protein DinB
MDFPKGMLAEMNADMKSNEEMAEANRKANRETIKEMTDANQERMNAQLAEMKFTVSAIEEEMEAAIHSMQSELQETIRHRIENVMTCINHEIQRLRKELTETQVELQELKMSFDTRTENFQKTIETIRADLITDLAVVDLGAKTTRKVSRRARVAWSKRNIVRNKWTSFKVERETRKVGPLRKNLRMHHEGRTGTKDLYGKRPLNPRKKRTNGIGIEGWRSRELSPLGRGGPTYKTLRKNLELEFVKRANGMSSRLRRMMDRTLWRVRPPPKRKKKLQIEQESVM